MNTKLFFTIIICSVCANHVEAQPLKQFAIVITELLPDPSPAVGLPGSEFIELKNLSSTAIAMRNWKISDGSSTATISTNFILPPDSFVIICPVTAINSYAVYGNTIGVTGFPSLNNDADNITLYSPEGRIIHSIAYTDQWYQNDIKSAGGWSLEMIDTHNPCGSNNNWKASINNTGGTPGTENSVKGIAIDEQSPALVRTYAIDSITVVAVFDEPLDSTSAGNSNNYRVNGSPNPVQFAVPVPPLYTEVQLQLNNTLIPGAVYTLTITNIADCAGNIIGMMNAAKTGLPVVADTMNIIVNEVLFNPKTDGYDYIELYNRSKNIIDCKQLYIANKTSSGSIINSKQVAATPYLLFPGEYLVITENKKWLQQNYGVKIPEQVIQLSALPSLPDDKGNIALLNFQGKIIDELAYEQQWHFALIDNKEGIALERINYNQPTQQKTNWTSAASTAGFGTPTYQNSQFRIDLRTQAKISILPSLFSPDNDGVDDFTTIHIQLTEPGYTGTLTIFDASGRKVKLLTANSSLAASSIFRWDGLDDHQQKLPIGSYILLTEIFTLQGNVSRFKNVLTLARRL